MNKLPIVYHKCYEFHSREELRFPIGKYNLLKLHLEKDNLLSDFNQFSPDALSKDQISVSHDREYVDRVFYGTLSDKEKRAIGLPYLDYFARRALFASGGTLLTAKLALQFEVALNLAGGSHHAGKNSGSGFCIFNDTAVACNCLLKEGLIGRAVILDLDVHQGDGTAEIFSGNEEVFTLSIHCEKNFPVKKKESNLDIGLAVGTSDTDYLGVLDFALKKIVSFDPDIIFYNSGVDVHEDDNLGHLKLSTHGVMMRERKVLDFALKNKIPIAIVLGGGYQKDIANIVKLHSIVFEEASCRYDPFNFGRFDAR